MCGYIGDNVPAFGQSRNRECSRGYGMNLYALARFLDLFERRL
jgi:hypothetical protein